MSATEPAGPAARAPVVFFRNQGGRWLIVPPRRRWAGEEIDVDATHAARSELDVAGAAPVVALALVIGEDRRPDPGGGDAPLPLGEHPGFGPANRRDVA